ILSLIAQFMMRDQNPTVAYPLSLHDALPISFPSSQRRGGREINKDAAKPPSSERTGWSERRTAGLCQTDHPVRSLEGGFAASLLDRKSTRLNSSHRTISYAVFCLKKKTPRK